MSEHFYDDDSMSVLLEWLLECPTPFTPSLMLLSGEDAYIAAIKCQYCEAMHGGEISTSNGDGIGLNQLPQVYYTLIENGCPHVAEWGIKHNT